ncbi:MAG: sialidase family protein, partial [Kiritimatiellae bacterium]|nr:sialidase family protein [Kiritimatiellia bacterium]
LFVKHGLKVNDRNNGRRSNLTAWVSDNDGETWKGGLLLEPLTCSYPDGVESPDGTIYIVYDHERDRAAELRMARFTEADVRAGEFASAGSQPGIIVFKARKRTRP